MDFTAACNLHYNACMSNMHANQNKVLNDLIKLSNAGIHHPNYHQQQQHLQHINLLQSLINSNNNTTNNSFPFYTHPIYNNSNSINWSMCPTTCPAHHLVSSFSHQFSPIDYCQTTLPIIHNSNPIASNQNNNGVNQQRKRSREAPTILDTTINVANNNRSIIASKKQKQRMGEGPDVEETTIGHDKLMIRSMKLKKTHDNNNGNGNSTITIGKGKRGRATTKSSSYCGVSRCLKDGRWQARIRYGKEVKYLGRFQTEEMAARTYDAALIMLYGKDSKKTEHLNFKDSLEIFGDDCNMTIKSSISSSNIDEQHTNSMQAAQSICQKIKSSTTSLSLVDAPISTSTSSTSCSSPCGSVDSNPYELSDVSSATNDDTSSTTEDHIRDSCKHTMVSNNDVKPTSNAVTNVDTDNLKPSKDVSAAYNLLFLNQQ